MRWSATALGALFLTSATFSDLQAVPIAPGGGGPTLTVNDPGVTQSFMSNRVYHTGTILLEILDHERFLSEEGGPKNGAGTTGVASNQGTQTFAALPSTNQRPMAFAPMPRGTGRSGRFASWAKGAFTSFNDDTVGADYDGDLGSFLAGVHYSLSDTLLVGLVGGYDDAKWKSDPLVTTLDGSGWLAGAYLRKDLGGESALSLTAMWGEADNDIQVAAVNGTFDSDRFLLLANYWKTWREGPRRISGNMGLLYAEEESDAYTLSNGTAVGSQSAELGRFFFGPEIAYKFNRGGGRSIEPLAWIRGIWDFENDGTIAVSNVTSVAREDFYGQVGGGLHFSVTDRISARVSVQYDGLGDDDYSATAVQGRLNIPLN